MTTLLALSIATALVGCAPDNPGDDPEDGFAIDEGKEDDFYSRSAREYVIQGETTVTLEAELAGADEEVKMARVEQLIGYKQLAIAWFLNEYLVEKSKEDPNASFGGYGALAKGGAWDDLAVAELPDGVTFRFTFRQIVAGGKNLMRALPAHTAANGDVVFPLEIGRPSNAEMARLESNHEWYNEAPWSPWDPSKVAPAQKEALELSIAPEHQSGDAWFDYDALFADGALDIDVHFGFDFYEGFHVKLASKLFTWLKDKGFTAPVASFDLLRRTSAPFTRTIDADGRTIQVKVRIFYGKDGAVTDPNTDEGGRRLEADLRASLASRDVIAYVGHSGPFFGFAMANWQLTDEGDLDDAELGGVTMPARYQIVLANGCDTYEIGQAFRANPAKADGSLLDVITSTSASNAASPATLEAFLGALLERDSQGRHRPRTFGSLLTKIDADWDGFHPMYGIHGIDDNPALHPYAVVENLCEVCSANADCGGPGNLCLGIGRDAERHCAAVCTDDRGCPDGYTCAAVASQSSQTIYDRACVPADRSCE